MRIDRIARPGALYGSSGAVESWGEVNRSMWNPVVSEEVDYANISSIAGNLKFHTPGIFRILGEKLSDVNKVNFPNKDKKGDSITHFEVRDLRYLGKAIIKL